MESNKDITKQGMLAKTRNHLNAWLAARFPVNEFAEKYLAGYYVPKNLNFWYYFGSFSLVVLVIQLITGIWLTMEYVPTTEGAFVSVQHIMREVSGGWLFRLIHTTGASALFVVLYLHMYCVLIYGAYQKPRELLWLMGMVLYFVLLFEAFTGHVLPWGQMSYWSASAMTSIASAMPGLGHSLASGLRGDFNVSGITLHRFFAWHVIAVPLLIVGIVFLQIVALHYVGPGNPDGIEAKNKKNVVGKPTDSIPFHPYYTIKNLFGISLFLFVFAAVLFYAPSMGGYFIDPGNYVPANPQLPPAHIAPMWYLTPFYAIFCVVSNPSLGAVTLAAAVGLMFIMPWLDRSPVRSIRYKGIASKVAIVAFVICFIGLSYIGRQPTSPSNVLFAQIFTIGYFLFFLLMPFYTAFEKTRPIPERVTE